MANAAQAIAGGAASGASVGSIVPGWGTLIGGLLGAGAGLVGYFIQSDHEQEAQAIMARAAASAEGITAASIAAAAADVLGPTKLAQIKQDPKYQQAQDETLTQLKRISDSGGMTLEDRAAFNDAIGRTGQQQQQLRQSALQEMRSRGLNSSGAETALLASGAQGAANATAEAGVNALASGQKRAMEALRDRATLAGNMQGADWQRQSQVASAQDVIDGLNWGNRMTQRQKTVNAANTAYNHAATAAGMTQQAGQQQARSAENTIAGAGQLATEYDAQNQAAQSGQQPKQTVTYTPKPGPDAYAGFAPPADTSGSEVVSAWPKDENGN